jgi:UDP-glucuronate decarboxylase
VRLLVTGGAGFLGSHLCTRLATPDNEIICLDDLSTGSLQNITHLIGSDNFKFILHDVREPISIDNLDGIFNFACPASPSAYQRDPIRTMMTSVQGSLNMLNLAKDNKAKIFQASTSEIYGDPLQVPQSEIYWGNVNPNGIRACYDEGKRAAESLFLDMYRKYNVKVKIGRIFNTYGPKMAVDDGRVVSNFIVQALLNKPITVFGDGNQTRSFCYVDDLITGVIRLFASDNFISPVNLGNPSSITIGELAREIVTITNSKSTIVYRPLPSDDPKKRQPNISLAMRELDWYPVIERDEGLTRTVQYFKTVLYI